MCDREAALIGRLAKACRTRNEKEKRRVQRSLIALGLKLEFAADLRKNNAHAEEGGEK